MRVLVSTTANDGHFGPVLPFARALVEAGHEVRVAAPESYAAAVTRAGFAHEPFGDAPPALIGPVMARLPTVSFEEANRIVIGEVFARIDAQAALPSMLRLMETWRPHLVLREPAELGSLAAAERLGVPHAQVAIGMVEMLDMFVSMTGGPLADLEAIAGVPEGQLMGSLVAETSVSTVPETLDLAGSRGSGTTQSPVRFRDATPADSDGRLPEPWGDPGLPLVYVTFGSVTAALGPFTGVYRGSLEALADLPIRVLLTGGRALDLATLDPVRANAHVEQWWPQAPILAEAAVVVGHGGYGTTMGAVAAGLPQAVVPLFTSDQVVNARHVAAAGAGVAVEGGPTAGPAIAEAVRRLLDDASYAARAQSLAAEMAALPSAAEAVPLLQGLAAG